MDFGDILRMTPEQYDEYRREQRLYGTEALKRQHDEAVKEIDMHMRKQDMEERYADVFDTKTREEGLAYFREYYRCTQEDINVINAVYDAKEEQDKFDDAVLRGLRSVWGDEGSSAS